MPFQCRVGFQRRAIAMRVFSHTLMLIGVVFLGAALRFWNLDAKSVWMDEVITALFSLGRSYLDVPLEAAFSLSALDQLFTLKPATCAAIAQTVSTQSVHPPLFFCWLHDWLNWVNWLQPTDHTWVWKLRSLPALAGVGAILTVYYLNRIAFSKSAALAGAIVMAVSPFAVYLSQEARHYTVPMLLLSLALLGMIRIQQDFRQQRLQPVLWLGWVALNGVGFYVHYFFILATIAQLLTLIALLLKSRFSTLKAPIAFYRHSWLTLLFAVGGIGLIYLPWLPTFLSHVSRPETDWLTPTQPGWLTAIAPLYQLLAGWVLMAIALPVENQPIWIVIPAAVLMLLFSGWLTWQGLKGLQKLWQTPETHWETLTLASFVGWVLVEFLAIVYLFHKDLTQVPRYNFIYYPAVCALVGASLGRVAEGEFTDAEPSKSASSWLKTFAPIVLFGLLSCGFVVSDRVFLKPYQPQQVARMMQSSGSESTIVVMAHQDLQDIALGLSFALALRENDPKTKFAFLTRSQGYGQVWENLKTPKISDSSPQNLWIIAPGLRGKDFPQQLSLSRSVCNRDPNQYYRLGVPYQGYRC